MIHKLSQMTSRIRNRRARRGQSMAEFAIALPVLLFVVLGFIEAARWFQAYLAVQYAATEAARYAVSGRPPMLIADGDQSCEEEKHPITGVAYTLPDDYQECRVDWIEYMGSQLAGYRYSTIQLLPM